MAEPTMTVIKRRSQTGEVEETLEMTQEEFDQIISQYSAGYRTFKKNIPYFHRIAAAQATARTGEELKMENINSVDKEGFEKAVCLMMVWSEMIFSELLKEEDFRIEIIYNAEAMKTNLFLYTPTKKHETDGTQPGHQEN